MWINLVEMERPEKCEIPFSELAMHCNIAGRTDFCEFLVNEVYAYVRFNDRSMCHGLISEVVPWEIQRYLPAARSYTSPKWAELVNNFIRGV